MHIFLLCYVVQSAARRSSYNKRPIGVPGKGARFVHGFKSAGSYIKLPAVPYSLQPGALRTHSPDAGLMLVRRRRRRTNISPASGEGLLFSGPGIWIPVRLARVLAGSGLVYGKRIIVGIYYDFRRVSSRSAEIDAKLDQFRAEIHISQHIS